MEKYSIESLIVDENELAEHYKEAGNEYGYKGKSKLVEYLKELKTYKDAEEQGLLLRLPCKIGSTVFKITEDWAEYKDGEIIVDAPFGNYTVENYILVHWKICEHKDVSLQWILENFGFFENGVYLDRAKAEEELMIQPTTIHSNKQKTWVWKPGLAEMKGVCEYATNRSY